MSYYVLTPADWYDRDELPIVVIDYDGNIWVRTLNADGDTYAYRKPNTETTPIHPFTLELDYGPCTPLVVESRPA